VGTASGINNAISRIGGLLAIAVLGVVMVAGFSSQLGHRLARVSMSPDLRTALQSDYNRLAALKPPAGVTPATATEIESAVAASFVFSFRLIMWICAGLALASAAVAWRMIPGRAKATAVQHLRVA
jgi:hypothetical protein